MEHPVLGYGEQSYLALPLAGYRQGWPGTIVAYGKLGWTLEWIQLRSPPDIPSVVLRGQTPGSQIVDAADKN